ncbi:MAG: tRNA pseudouridine synthase A [Leptolyngbya sp. PLA3]|nr:MAG: tRNA pseudouridine synthase A [Cyanobacteria bacterium CYA]MCE7967675.1 tRNA pseudouridine synthase A [Leptolyngbya sp. PL-A3]
MPRYKLVIAYDGTDFHGWQKQHPPADAEHTRPEQVMDADHTSAVPEGRVALRTVQEVVEHAARLVCREPVLLTGASRTDAGVHAAGQVAAFTSNPEPQRGVGWPGERGCDRLVRALNGALPGDVVVRSAEIVSDEFDPIRDAVEKEYTYTIQTGEQRPIWERRFAFHTWYALDAGAMARAGSLLEGEHDFASFAQISHGRASTVRTISGCRVEQSARVDHLDGPAAPGERIVIRVSGSGFLYNMVRIVAGTLLEVGRGRIDADAIPRIIAACDRRAAGPTLPPEGLRLEWVRYGQEMKRRRDGETE